MRTYDDGCAIVHALDLVGERWVLLVVRELLLEPKRFTELRAGIPKAIPAFTRQLSQRPPRKRSYSGWHGSRLPPERRARRRRP